MRHMRESPVKCEVWFMFWRVVWGRMGGRERPPSTSFILPARASLINGC
jgi:hypothetical protein